VTTTDRTILKFELVERTETFGPLYDGDSAVPPDTVIYLVRAAPLWFNTMPAGDAARAAYLLDRLREALIVRSTPVLIEAFPNPEPDLGEGGAFR
jgi:hypothetical protein